jgi:hypothetical protein
MGAGVSGIGMKGDPMPIFYWDLGVYDGSGVLSPTNSLFQVAYNENPSATNIVGQDPLFVAEFATGITTMAWRGNPNFVNTTMVVLNVPPKLMGDYHLQAGSPAVNKGAAQKGVIGAPNQDFDRGPRPTSGGYEIGADELAVGFPATPPLVAAPAAPVKAPQFEALKAKPEAGSLIFLPFVRVKYILGADWLGQKWGYEVDGDQVFVSGGGAVLWNSAQPYGGDQEAYFRFTSIAAEADHQDLLLKVEGLGADGAIEAGTRLVAIHYDRVNQALTVKTLQDGVWAEFDALNGVDFQAGDLFGARVADRGIVEVYRNNQLLLTTDLTAGSSLWPQSGVLGRIGVWFNSVNWEGLNMAGFRSFGGGTMP